MQCTATWQLVEKEAASFQPTAVRTSWLCMEILQKLASLWKRQLHPLDSSYGSMKWPKLRGWDGLIIALGSYSREKLQLNFPKLAAYQIAELENTKSMMTRCLPFEPCTRLSGVKCVLHPWSGLDGHIHTQPTKLTKKACTFGSGQTYHSGNSASVSHVA